MSRNNCLNILLFADEHIIIKNPGYELYKSDHNLNTLICNYRMTISTTKNIVCARTHKK